MRVATASTQTHAMLRGWRGGASMSTFRSTSIRPIRRRLASWRTAATKSSAPACSSSRPASASALPSSPPVLQQRDHRRLGVDVVWIQFERAAEAGFGLGAAVQAELGEPQRRPGGRGAGVGLDGGLGGLFAQFRPAFGGHEPGVVAQQHRVLAEKFDRLLERLLGNRQPLGPPCRHRQQPVGMLVFRVELDRAAGFVVRLLGARRSRATPGADGANHRPIGHFGHKLVADGQCADVVLRRRARRKPVRSDRELPLLPLRLSPGFGVDSRLSLRESRRHFRGAKDDITARMATAIVMEHAIVA